MSAIATLYREELKALTRGRFAWLGAAVVLLAVGGLATVGTLDTWLDGYGIIAYGVLPLGFLPVAAVAFSSPRANRFVESVFTAPVDRRDWFVAKVLVVLTAAAAYYIALVPMALVYAHHVGVPFLFGRLLIWAPGLLLAATSIGTLIGVCFIGRSIAAPAATAMGVLLAYGGMVPLQELLVAQGNGASRTGHVTLLSPAVLLKNALGFTLVTASVPATSSRTWICLAVLVVGAMAVAAWTFLRAQGVETWEATRGQRWALAVVIAAITVSPAIMADTNYDRPAPRPTNAPTVRGVFGRAIASLALVDPGRPAPAHCCSAVLNRDEDALAMDRATSKDLLVLLPVDATQRITSLQLRASGEGGLDVQPVSPESVSPDHLERRDYPNDTGPTAIDGHHIPAGWVARVNVVLQPTHAWDVGGMRYPIDVVANYRLEGEAAPRTFSARGGVDARITQAFWEMGVASAILPLFCLVAAILRWRRTR